MQKTTKLNQLGHPEDIDSLKLSNLYNLDLKDKLNMFKKSSLILKYEKKAKLKKKC